MSFVSGEPIVKLHRFFSDPFDIAIATARTCYSDHIVNEEEVVQNLELRDEIAESTLNAGHLTTRQHCYFMFQLDKVSRQVLWSFFHSHQFYNSEQVSQRFKKVKKDNFFVPQLDEKSLQIYLGTVQMQMDAYEKLRNMLIPTVAEFYYANFPARKNDEGKWINDIRKKSQEVARYVLPVATFAHLYHTINLVTLYRYHQAALIGDCPEEAFIIVKKMVGEVLKVDSQLQKEIPPMREVLPEFVFKNRFEEVNFERAQRFVNEFDSSLEGRVSKLIDYMPNAQEILARSVREIFGIPTSELNEEDAIHMLLDSGFNFHLSDTLDGRLHSKLSKAMHNITYTFRKKISHTADSQNQRHRMVPGSRPQLATHYTGQSDYVVPELMKHNQDALALYEKVLGKVFSAINVLLERGVSAEKALYLLPNAFPVRFTESGNLMHLYHKYIKRLCYNAQEEIFSATRDEAEQIESVHPSIGRIFRAPCRLRFDAKETPYCPEGKRYCGVRVWNFPGLEEYKRII